MFPPVTEAVGVEVNVELRSSELEALLREREAEIAELRGIVATLQAERASTAFAPPPRQVSPDTEAFPFCTREMFFK